MSDERNLIVRHSIETTHMHRINYVSSVDWRCSFECWIVRHIRTVGVRDGVSDVLRVIRSECNVFKGKEGRMVVRFEPGSE
jgi:hypothetical protein